MSDPSSNSPKVTVGIFVRNGENFLETALKSILGQTFTDMEVVVSDNVSTDRTEEICKRYAGTDSRIRYIRQPRNIGAAPNCNYLFRVAKGEYFKWAAHDDAIEPTFIERCVGVLEEDPDVVVAFANWRFVDDQGASIPFHVVPGYDGPPDLYHGIMADDPVARFRALVTGTRQPVPPIFGLMRSSALRQTTLHESFFGSDRLLLLQLGLLGRYQQVPDVLFQHRLHEGQSYLLSKRERRVWISGRPPGLIVLPQWGLFRGYLRAATRIPGLTARQRLRCLATVFQYALSPRQLRRLLKPGGDSYWSMGDGQRQSNEA